MIQIGPYSLASPVVLAPMAGVTDQPFRKLCRRFGAALTPSEMLSARPDLWHSQKSSLRRRHEGEARPRVVQIAGAEPAMLAQAAQLNVAHGADIIDINMGCPAKKVLQKAAGSALLRDEGLVREILQAVVAAVAVPVTLKIRTGWSPEQRNGVRIAQLAADAGIQSLAVHGRTRACAFKGAVEYDTIRAITQSVSIPVFANGDIGSPQQALAVLEHTGASGVMIGRSAQGRPWIFRDIIHYLQTGAVPPPPSAKARWRLIREHLSALHDFYGEYMGLRIARKHLAWYLQDETGGRFFRQHFNRLECPAAQHQALDDFFRPHLQKQELAA